MYMVLSHAYKTDLPNIDFMTTDIGYTHICGQFSIFPGRFCIHGAIV